MIIKPCESCKQTRKTYPTQFPRVPMNFDLCGECRAAGVIPYDILVTMVWLGELGTSNRWALDVALYHGYSSTQFAADCANFSDKMDEAFKED